MKNKQTETKSKSTPGVAHLTTWILWWGAAILICSSAAAQNLFMSDGYSGIANNLGHIYELTPSGASSTFAGRLDGSEGLAFDKAGNLFVATEGNINKITPGGARSVFASGLVNYPFGLAFDSSGNLFVADAGNIYKFTPNGVRSTFASGLSYPHALAVDGSGNLFVADLILSGNQVQGGNIYKFSTSGVRSTFASGVSPYALAFDSAGNLFVTAWGNPGAGVAGYVYKYTSDGVRSTFAQLGIPMGLAFDSSGNLFVMEVDSGHIYKFTPNGQRSTFATIPGLVLDQTGFLAFQPPQTPTTPANISTRGSVETGENVLISGFILSGSDPKPVIIRGLGPTLANFGVPDALQDPVLELYGIKSLIASNDDWQSAGNANQIPISYRPANSRESAIMITLQPGSYTAVMHGKNPTTGIGLLEVYSDASALTNVSTRGFVGTGDHVLIGGFSGGIGSIHVIIRALGPTLTQFGVSSALADPTLSLRDGNGNVVVFNDDWKATQQSTIQATGLAPHNDLESAILATLPNGNYTAIVSGKNGATGVGLVEVYKLQ